MKEKIVYVTTMKEMPKSCFDCTLHLCRLPDKVNREGEVKKKYMSKRHENCPLEKVLKVQMPHEV